MDFSQILDLLIQFGELLLDLSERVVDFFSTPITDLIDFFFPDVVMDRLVALGLGDISLIVFMIGGGFGFFVVYTVIKWILDLIF